MITTRVIPAATATSQTLLVEIEEQLCRPYCVSSTQQPAASVSFKAGAVTLLDGNAVVPITATVTIVTPGKCSCAHTQVFTEVFDVAFAETTANTITADPGDDVVSVPALVKCCKAYGVKLSTTLTLTIA